MRTQDDIWQSFYMELCVFRKYVNWHSINTICIDLPHWYWIGYRKLVVLPLLLIPSWLNIYWSLLLASLCQTTWFSRMELVFSSASLALWTQMNLAPLPNTPFQTNFDVWGCYLIFIKFNCLRWIRSGYDSQNPFVKYRFHRFRCWFVLQRCVNIYVFEM